MTTMQLIFNQPENKSEEEFAENFLLRLKTHVYSSVVGGSLTQSRNREHFQLKFKSNSAAGVVLCLFLFFTKMCLLPSRELLRCESALARLYCRMALLNIFAPKNPHTFTRLFHIPAIRDITLEHLQLLSNQLLAPPLPGESDIVCFFEFI